MDPTLASLKKFSLWCRQAALPYWANHGLNPKGGSYERLHMDGSPDVNALQRMRVQARQAYVYAHAGDLGWYKDAKIASDHCWNYLTELGFVGGDGSNSSCAHLLSPDGSVYDHLKDTYDQAFVILAGAWRYLAFKDENALNVAKRVLLYLDTSVNAYNGGWLEGKPATLPRRQNPHMHMFEALLALYRATGSKVYLDKLEMLFQLFKDHFFDAKSDTIVEFFNQDWTRTINNGGPIVPGHMMEWCWLLHEYSGLGYKEAGSYSEKLFFKAIEIGLSKNNHLLCDEIDTATVTQPSTFRSWPQTEYVKACLAMARRKDDFAYATRAAHVIERITAVYLDSPPNGGWVDMVDEDNCVVSSHMQTSTFYHLLGAAEAADRFIREQVT